MQSSSESSATEGSIIVLIGPGGTGKGTVAARLVDADEALWLSRSWTTRTPREGEHPEAYVFVDREAFLAHADAGGFLEYAEFLGNLYGTPLPDVSNGTDVLLEIEIEGARQVLEHAPNARVILLIPPSEEVQAHRLRGRGDPEDHVVSRVEKGRHELAEGRRLAHYEVVNDDIEIAVAEVLGIVEDLRRQRSAPHSG